MKILLIVYITPMILNTLLMYFDKDVKTVGNLLEGWWLNLIPFANIFITFLILVDIITESIWKLNLNEIWNKFKNIKIK